MDIRELIIKHLKEKGEVRTSDIVKMTGFSRAYVHRFFRELSEEGSIIPVGKSNNAHYVLLKGKTAKHARREICGIFKRYTDESVEFSKTEVQVKLYRMGVEYVSRSQARRIIAGLDKFKTVILDFRDVETIGQAFADEIFRVWQANHPDFKIVPKNANENVVFMIRRAVSTAGE